MAWRHRWRAASSALCGLILTLFIDLSLLIPGLSQFSHHVEGKEQEEGAGGEVKIVASDRSSSAS